MALVSKFCRLGNLLKPTIGLSLKVWAQSCMFNYVPDFSDKLFDIRVTGVVSSDHDRCANLIFQFPY